MRFGLLDFDGLTAAEVPPALSARSGRLPVELVASVLSALPFQAAYAATQTFYRPADGILHIAGHGFGHGHGMSQWGAYGGAENGKTWQQIVAWYYASPALSTKSGTLGVQITADGRGSDGVYDTQVLPVDGLNVRDSAGHTLALPTTNASGTKYDKWRAMLSAGGSFAVQGHTSSGWASVAPTGGTVTSWSGTWVRFADSKAVQDRARSELYRSEPCRPRGSGEAADGSGDQQRLPHPRERDTKTGACEPPIQP